eukprot:Plantae.Rhodophyta-Hildenbrandia_rubra.ctg80110.p4 GENE.Plantae.Rhodophyta-Hildenbrandia_rubra.ctg80110~~Plantae.Rhodophyta-Hildenbrandia_rubra.ctg80110.p4  ORF type:complete len:128 (-),score=10.91 Plantae.Rhodophyta-Hildenbrandia_rubra.ctg80110:116-499(-)
MTLHRGFKQRSRAVACNLGREGVAVLALVDFVRRATREDLFLAPVRHGTKGIAADEVGKGLFFRPLAGDQIRCAVGGIFPQRGVRMPFGGVQSIDYTGEFIFKVLLLTFNDVVVHADGDHGEILPDA